MIDKALVVGPFGCNCRLIACPRTGEAALVDPGDEAERIVQLVQQTKASGGKPLQVKYLLHTHAHLDHVGATRRVKEALADLQGEVVPQIFLHQGDLGLYQNLKAQGMMLGLRFEQPAAVDHYFEHEQDLKVGDLKLTLLHTPGHTPGSICLRLHEDSDVKSTETVFSGDTLFQFSVGRTDLPGGDWRALLRSIQEHLLTLDDDTRVCPGHGPETKIGFEKRANPFLQ